MEVAVGEIEFRVINFPGLLGDVWRFVDAFKGFFPDGDWPFDLSAAPDSQDAAS